VRRLFFLILISMNLFANSVVDIYRNIGINAVESFLDKQLQSKEYWKEYLKDYNVTYGYYEDLDTLMIANKAKKELLVFDVNKNGLDRVDDYKNVIVGANGDKQKEGDLKTPIGVYEITKRFFPEDQFYGPLAFVLSYPNTFDRVRGKDGYGIWIHGSPLDGSPRDSMSKGCIVLDNSRIKKLDKFIKPRKSVILVSESVTPLANKDEVSLILAELFRWRAAWRDNKIEKYLDFYAKNFKRFDKMTKQNFSKMKRRIFARGEDKLIIFKNINISPYPNEIKKKLYKIGFYEIYKTKSYQFRGNKELYVELKDDSFSILSEK